MTDKQITEPTEKIYMVVTDYGYDGVETHRMFRNRDNAEAYLKSLYQSKFYPPEIVEEDLYQ